MAVEVYFGHASKHAVRLAGSDAQTAHLHDLVIFGSLAVCVVVMILVSKMARRALMQAVAETNNWQAESDSKTA